LILGNPGLGSSSVFLLESGSGGRGGAEPDGRAARPYLGIGRLT
jgi:hypothetical protein